LILSAGCQSTPSISQVDATLIPATEPVSVPSTVSPPEGNSPHMTPTSSTPADSALQALIEKAKEDLAQRINVSTNEIRVVDATEVEWSDSSLGCPQPGMLYLQVITPGYQIVLEANGTPYEYHSNKSTLIVFCENPNPGP
jgi:hypothetical protein